MKRFLLLAATSIIISVLTAGVPPAQLLEFEAASVKVSLPGNNGVRGGCHGIDSKSSVSAIAAPPLGRCVITDARLSHLISIAYGLKSLSMLKGAPDWVIGGSERFTIEAKCEDPAKTSEAQLLEMLRNLLVDRFQLKFHRENKEMPGFALLVGKNGAKLPESQSLGTIVAFGPRPKPSPDGPNTLKVRKFSTTQLANLLSQFNDEVVDQTGLSGEYDFQLAWDETAGPSLTTALQEQLGLRLERRKLPVSYFVFDSARKLTGN